MGSTTTTEQKMPEFQETFLKETVIPYATDIAGREYTPYEGERVAGMTPLEQQAMTGYGTLSMGEPQFTQAGETYGRLADYQMTPMEAAALGPASTMEAVGQVGDITAGQISGTDIGQYMSPYTQNVIEASLRTLGGAQEQSLGQQAASAQKAKAFGGSRHGVAEAETRKAYGQQASDLITNQMQQAYQQAQQAAQFDIGQRMQADTLNQRAAEMAAQREQAARAGNMAAANQFAQQQAMFQQAANQATFGGQFQGAGIQQAGAAGLTGLAGAEQQAQLAGLGAQMQAGGLGRGLSQAELDAQFAEFARQQDFPLTGLNALATAASGIPSGYGTTTQSYGGFGPMLSAFGSAGMGMGPYGFNVLPRT